ncbi:MAG TPA: penicillin-binding protein activator [Rhodobacteraceae bacterium]|nr:penicillin-binding protein activator [Paracoccaceae bacterium]
MFAFLCGARKFPGAIVAMLSLVWLTACGGGFTGIGGGGPTIDTSKPVPVALLVPGGGGNAADDALASSLENAARLAMSELDGVTIDLRVYNTAGNPNQTITATAEAVREGAKIILGPVYAPNAAAAGSAAPGLNVLAFSNNPSVAGGNVFVLGNTFENTASRLVRYAAASGKGNILVVNGENPAETLGRDAVLRAISTTSGASQAGVTSFEVSQTGVINAVPEITKAARSSGASSVFLTSGTDGAIPFLAQLLPENGLGPSQVQYIGLQRWDVPASARTLPGLQNGWFAMPDPGLQEQFQQRYLGAYGSSPHAIAGLAYDGIAAIGALVKAGKADALTGAALTQGQGFVGVNGVFRLLPNGTTQRGLAIAQVQNKEIAVIDPAPRSFAGAGY